MTNQAAIIGAGIAGLSAGIALRKAGYDVTLYEQAPEIQPLGAALSIWGNAMAGLDWMGCGDAVRKGSAKVDSITMNRLDGRTLFGPADVAETDSWLPTRAHLQGVLLDTLGRERCRFGVRMDNAEQRGDKAVLLADDEIIAEADLVIVADGIWSQIGIDLLGNPPYFAGYIGALGISEDATGDWPDRHGEEVWGDSERFGFFDAGDRRRYWFYMVSAQDAGEVDGLTLGHVQSRSEHWPKSVRATVSATDEANFIPLAIHTRAAPKRLGEGRIICIGDAAHAMEPNQGQGACQSIEDTWALGVLAGRHSPENILPHLEKARLKRIRQVVRDSMLVGRVIHSPRAWERSMAQGMFSITPKAIDNWQLNRRLQVPTY